MAADKHIVDEAAATPRIGCRSGEPISALQSEVMSAVRGAITSVMAGQGKGIDLTGLDLDFSSASARAQLPVLRAKPEQALALRSHPPRSRDGTKSRAVLAATLTVAIGGAGVATWLQAGPSTEARPATATSASMLMLPTSLPTAPVKALDPALTVQPTAVPVIARSLAPDLAKKAAFLPQPEPAQATISAALPAVPAVPTQSDVADQARKLLEGGHVQQARALLLGAADSVAERARSGLALTLARSFDGNYLRTLDHADATGDSTQARRWYLRWFEFASKDGSVPKTMRLDRLLASLE